LSRIIPIFNYTNEPTETIFAHEILHGTIYKSLMKVWVTP
jgi:hypothetical protein